MDVLIADNEKVVWQGKGDSVFLPLEGGDVVVMEQHSPMVGILRKGTLKVSGTDAFSIEVTRGVVKVKDNSIDVFIR